jgi:hypothetical protein
MKIKSIILFLTSSIFLSILLISCETPSELPLEPKISFERVMFKDLPAGPDSLIVEINFTDGDGNLGLGKNENNIPFHPFDFRTSATGARIKYDKKNPELPPYSCLNWVIIREAEKTDTFQITRNKFHHNYIVDFFRRRNGQWEEYDWRKLQAFDCGENFYGRFPLLNTTGTKRSLEGVLRYGMTSSGFKTVFRNDTIKLRIQIIDRDLNESNVLETPGFTLNGVSVPIN